MTVAFTVSAALEASGLAAIDARVLLSHVLQRDRTWLVAHADDAVTPAQAERYRELVHRRGAGEPIAYLTGWREFWGLRLAITSDVLIPRPETETLVDLALALLPADRAIRVLDLGTGSGAIALAIAHERPRARVLATDVAAPALAVARGNARRLALTNVEFMLSDWLAAVPRLFHGDAFDLVVSNPPYIAEGDPHLAQGDLRHEPVHALSSGVDGLAALRRIVQGAHDYLIAGGALMVEHGFDQADAVRELLIAAHYSKVISTRDLAGIPRVVSGRTVVKTT